MKTRIQNLTEDKKNTKLKSAFWHGRSWTTNSRHDNLLRIEWAFLKFADSFGLSLRFSERDDDDGLCLHAAIPFLFSIWIVLPGFLCVKKNCELGFAIHNEAIWFYTGTFRDDSSSSDPWYRKSHCWNFPWQYRWHSTEILDNDLCIPERQKTVFIEVSRRGRHDRSLDAAKDRAIESVKTIWPYTYKLNNGQEQKVQATIHADRMTWRMKWWPLLPFKKVRTTIDVWFSSEVGEKAGSWKGGCLGCGYEMKYGEAPWHTLERMERERKF